LYIRVKKRVERKFGKYYGERSWGKAREKRGIQESGIQNKQGHFCVGFTHLKPIVTHGRAKDSIVGGKTARKK